MKNVRIIPVISKENKKLRVAAYCRVSTSGAEQLRSLEIQLKTYTKMIRNHPNWLFAECSMTSKADYAGTIEPGWTNCSRKQRRAKLITLSPSQSAECREKRWRF